MSAINAASADIDLSMGAATADVAVGKRSVIFHLTKGFSLAQVEDQGAEPGPAFTALGHVKAPGGEASVKGWDFGFVQIAKLHSGTAFYAGRKRSEGSIAIYFEKAMSAPILLDSLAGRTPWTVGTDRFSARGGEVTAQTADHPALKVPRELRNSGRNIQNFLFHVIDKREFWSVLTAVDPNDKRQHLAHFHWEIRHNVMFSWQGGEPVVVKKDSAFTLHGKAKGAPGDAELQGLLANPVPPQFNDAAQKPMLQSYWGARGPNRTENDGWFTNVPPNFWG